MVSTMDLAVIPLILPWKLGSLPVEAVLRAFGCLKPPVPDVDVSGKVVIVTGANTGIGRRTAFHLARMGAKVIMACRSVQKGEEACTELEQELRDTYAKSGGDIAGGTGDADVSARHEPGTLQVMQLDLADLESVEVFAAEFRAKYSRLDTLVNNAGLAGVEGLTADGLDMTFGVNFIGHFALTLELLPLIQTTPAARVVCLSSMAHHAGGTNWESAARGHRGYAMRSSYADSKLAMVLFAKELRRRFAMGGSSATAFAVNPGGVRSDIWRTVPSWFQPILRLLARLLFLTTDEGCRPSVCVSTMPLHSLAGSDYYQPYWLPFNSSKPFEILGVYAGCAPAYPAVPKDEPAASAELWAACERMIETAGAARGQAR